MTKFEEHQAAVAKSLRDLAILWGKPPDPENDNAAGQSGEVGKTEHTGQENHSADPAAVQGGNTP